MFDAPIVKVLGVYRLNATEALFREQFSILFSPELLGSDRAMAERQIRQQLGSVVLVEALVLNRDGRFRTDDFVQAEGGIELQSGQAAWAEAYLTPDGMSLAVERWSDAPELGDLRVAFFIHFWNPTVRLRSSYGEIICPLPQPMPERLERLMPFEPVD